MTSETQSNADDETPDTETLEEPSTEKAPGEEPKGGKTQPEPDHEAVGIGVIGGPQVDEEAIG